MKLKLMNIHRRPVSYTHLGKSDAKFYNNIVVNKGKMTLGAGFNEQEIDYGSNIFVGFNPVSYTHLAVYKRQIFDKCMRWQGN